MSSMVVFLLLYIKMLMFHVKRLRSGLHILRFRVKRESSYISSRLISDPNPLCWASGQLDGGCAGSVAQGQDGGDGLLELGAVTPASPAISLGRQSTEPLASIC